MGLYDMITGKATMGADITPIKEHLLEGEEIISSYQFFRDSIILTTLGIYEIDVQGMTGKKVEIKFFPKKNIKSVSYETAGSFDLDVDIKIGVDGNSGITNGIFYNMPISFKVNKKQANEAKEVIKLVKQFYLCD